MSSRLSSVEVWRLGYHRCELVIGTATVYVYSGGNGLGEFFGALLVASYAIILTILGIIFFQVYRLVGINWKEGAPLKNPVDEIFKQFLKSGSQLPGIRLICEDDKGYPLSKLSVWDSILGCFLYCSAFVGLLWLTTPLPDVSIHLFIVTNFEPRTTGPPPEAPQHIHLPVWHPAGGEGPIMQPVPIPL